MTIETPPTMTQVMNAVSSVNIINGWSDPQQPRPIIEHVALLTSELGELVDTMRKRPDARSKKVPNLTLVQEEIADIIIRAFDLANEYDVTTADVIAKISVNQTRGYRHGNLNF